MNAKRYRWAVVGMLWMVCFFNYADRQAIFSVVPLLSAELHLDTAQIGLIGSCFAWVYGLSGPLAGFVVDRIRRKSAVVGALLFWSVVCSATALSRTFRQLLFFRTAEGLGESLYHPASISLLGDYHGPATRSRALGIVQTSVYAGTIGGGYWAASMAERHGWRFSFVVLGALGCLLAVVLAVMLREPVRGASDLPGLRAEPRPALLVLANIVRNKTVLCLMAAFACANFGAMVLLSWMPLYLYTRFHLGLGRAALDATVYPQMASILGALCGGYLADRLARKTIRGRMIIQASGLFLIAPFVVAAGLTASHLLLVCLLGCWGFCKGIYDANIFAAAIDFVHPADRGATTGLMNCVGWLLGGGAAPYAIGLLARHMPLGSAISCSGGVYVLAALLLLIAVLVFARKENFSQVARSSRFS